MSRNNPPSRNKKARSSKELDAKIKTKVAEFSKLYSAGHCYPLLIVASIQPTLVDDVFEELRRDCLGNKGRLAVLVDSGGGDIDAAYNLAQIFRRFGSKNLDFIVPRWAKSAATLLVCAGDRILMAPPAELGPLDPVILAMNPLERRMESFSPLDIDSTLELIRAEYKKGSKQLAEALMKRLQWPLTLGSFKKSLDISRQYLEKLLSTRMLKSNAKLAKEIAEKLTTGYSDHGFCINLEEAQAIGLKAEPLQDNQLDIVWEIHKLHRRRQEIEQEFKRKEVAKRLKELPPELIEILPEKIMPHPNDRD